VGAQARDLALAHRPRRAASCRRRPRHRRPHFSGLQRYEHPKTLSAGPVEEFSPGAPKLFNEENVWVVRLTQNEFVALYDRGLESKCPLQWRREFEFMGRTGWFEDTCNGYAYDLTGRCFSDACRGALLDGFDVTLSGGSVEVDLRALQSPAPADPLATPLTPPVQ